MRQQDRKGLMAASLLLLSVALCSNAADYTPLEKGASLDGVKNYVAEAAKSGKKVEVWLTVLGSLQKTELVKSDAKTISVKVQNHVFDQNWDKISLDQFYGIGKSCVQGDAKRALALADFAIAHEFKEKADEALTLAAQCSQNLGAELTNRDKFIKAMVNPAVAAATSTPAASTSTPAQVSSPSSSISANVPSSANFKPYAPPAKISFKASQPGNLSPAKDVAAAIDNAIEINLAEMGIRPAPVADDVTFLRRASLDITGQLPTPEEVIDFHKAGNSTDKRIKKIEELLERAEYADHWSTFWSVIMIGRRTRDDDSVKTSQFKTWLRDQFAKNQPFDKVVTEIMTATGDNDRVGPVNYLTHHMDSGLPITVAHVTQTFLGARIGCAQCHDHPFDKWSQQDFWSFAAFLANTRSEGRALYEDKKNPRRPTKQWRELTDQDQRNGGGLYEPPQPDLRLPPKALDGPVLKITAAPPKSDVKGGDLGKKDAKGMDKKDMAMDKKDMAMDKKDMKDMKSDNKMMGMMGSVVAGADGGLGLQYRKALAAWMTDPKNEKFSQSAVNRIWRAMFGHGLVEPIDDIRPKNPPSHPDVMNILAHDFNASGRDFKRLIAVIAATKAYQRTADGKLTGADRYKEVRYAARAEVRPMTPEVLLCAIVKATGGEEKINALMGSMRGKSSSGGMMMGNDELNEFNAIMQRFINTSTAEDRAGKLQFEGTVPQALMMMHSGFMNTAIQTGVNRFKKKGQGDMTYIFAATLGRPPSSIEQSVFARMNDLESIMWILLNSAEFVTVH